MFIETAFHYAAILISGEFNNWWDAETEKKFLEKAECMERQYNNYTIEQINTPLNGAHTLGENIADNGGLREAYYAYRKFHFTCTPYVPFLHVEV